MEKVIIIFFCFLFFPFVSKAATINVVDGSGNPSCEEEYIQTAIAGANSGDTVIVPAGDCTWTTRVSMTTVNKGITIQGAGIGKTNITIDTTGWSSAVWPKAGLYISGTEGYPIRITGLSFSYSGLTPADGAICVWGTIKNFRIDHCSFMNIGAIRIGRNYGPEVETFGVIDHNTFTTTNLTSPNITNILAMGSGLGAWSAPANLGTENAIYIEDNTFKYAYKNDSAIQGGYGVKYVFRYNNVQNTGVDAHGSDSSNVSSFSWEVYNNTFTHTGTLDSENRDIVKCPSALYMRGGTGVAFNNKIINTRKDNDSVCGWCNYHKASYQLMYFRSCFNEDLCTAFGVPSVANLTPTIAGDHCTICGVWNSCPIKSRCDGGGDAIIDGNLEGQYGWPCYMQPGTTGGGNKIGTAVAPMYAWNNTRDGEEIGFMTNTNDCPDFDPVPNGIATHIQMNRDYYNGGVAENNGIYTHAAGLSYKPYIYPHPLITDCVNNPITCDQVQSTCTPGDGDIDCNGQVNSQDIQLAINIFLGTANQDDSDYQAKKTRADLNSDNTVNVQDIQKIINIVLGIQS